jgi:hypothetical protein
MACVRQDGHTHAVILVDDAVDFFVNRARGTAECTEVWFPRL